MKASNQKPNQRRSPVPPKSAARSGNGGKRTSAPKKPRAVSGSLEGEGSYRATRDYNRHLQTDLKSLDVDQSAARARRALRTAEADELRQAEQVGKRGPQSLSKA